MYCRTNIVFPAPPFDGNAFPKDEARNRPDTSIRRLDRFLLDAAVLFRIKCDSTGLIAVKNVVGRDVGPPGTGKSHLCIALGVEPARAGKSVYFGTLAEIVASMVKAEREGNLAQRVRFLARNSLLIVDEMGYLAVGVNGGNLFFQLTNACYEWCAVILTSNRSFGELGDVFGDSVVAAALRDRLLHHAVVIHTEGSSYRLCEHADLLPEHLRNRPSSFTQVPAEPVRRRPGRPKRSSSDHISG